MHTDPSICFLGAANVALHRPRKRHLGVPEFVAANSLIFAFVFSIAIARRCGEQNESP